MIVEDQKVTHRFSTLESSPLDTAKEFCNLHINLFNITTNIEMALCVFPVKLFLERYYTIEELYHWSLLSL